MIIMFNNINNHNKIERTRAEKQFEFAYVFCVFTPSEVLLNFTVQNIVT